MEKIKANNLSQLNKSVHFLKVPFSNTSFSIQLMSPSSSYVFQAPRAKHNLCLKWEHLCSNFRPTATKGSISGEKKQEGNSRGGLEHALNIRQCPSTRGYLSQTFMGVTFNTHNSSWHPKIFQNYSFHTTVSPVCSPVGTALCCL